MWRPNACEMVSFRNSILAAHNSTAVYTFASPCFSEIEAYRIYSCSIILPSEKVEENPKMETVGWKLEWIVPYVAYENWNTHHLFLYIDL